MRTVRDLSEWKSAREALKGRVGFVPTMGALHEGHASLLRRARNECDSVILSVFVNPTQFDNKEDLAKYPITLSDDLAMAEREGVDLVLLPTPAQLYPDDYRYKISESELSRSLCGAHRPGHFDGVLSVVMKLFSLARADRAYFGEKDYQQFLLIKGMAEAFFLPTEVVPCPTVREADGIAMSSRNRRLSAEERALAAEFPKSLMNASTDAAARAALENAGFRVDYVEDRDGRRFAAAFLGSVRLIDNVAI